MKIELTVALDIPDADALGDAELRQALFDSYVNYVSVQHLGEVVQWTASLARYESAGDDAMLQTARRIVGNHQAWAEIGRSAEIVAVRRLDEEPDAEGLIQSPDE